MKTFKDFLNWWIPLTEEEKAETPTIIPSASEARAQAQAILDQVTAKNEEDIRKTSVKLKNYIDAKILEAIKAHSFSITLTVSKLTDIFGINTVSAWDKYLDSTYTNMGYSVSVKATSHYDTQGSLLIISWLRAES